MAEEKAKKQANPAVIQAVKAVAVLVVICLVCGALLALCNDLLYIDDDTRLERAMQKVYPDFKLKQELKVDSKVTASYGKVNRVLSSTDGAYIIEALGVGGYQNGTVTLYVVVGSDAKIKGWAVKENDKQSYIDRVPSNAGTSWYVGDDVSNELALVMTGATVKATSTAINNAVNMAAYYCRTALGLGENPEGEAKKAAVALLTDKGYSYTESNLTKFSGQAAVGTALNGESDTLSYIFVATGDDGNAYVYVYGEGDGIKIVVVKDYELIANSNNVTDEDDIVTNVLSKPIMEIAVTQSIKLYAFISDIKEEDGKHVYTVTGIKGSGYDPDNYTLGVTIETDGYHGKVSGDIELIVNGFVPFPPETAANALIEGLKGATLATVDDLYSAGKVANATQSANIIMAAVKAALTHYDANFVSAND